jgi:hypothetical protein
LAKSGASLYYEPPPVMIVDCHPRGLFSGSYLSPEGKVKKVHAVAACLTIICGVNIVAPPVIVANPTVAATGKHRFLNV